MNDLRSVYLAAALDQMPRLLSLQDRNPFSPTYGSFHRLYWLDKSLDFPDAMAQFAVQALALVYANDFPGNPYFHQPKIREWVIAGLDYWARIQHTDGSFDEYYPYERGWVGPTGFTLYAAMEAFGTVRAQMPSDVARRVLVAIRRAAHFVAAGEAEEDRLANHHALACVAVWQAWELLGDRELQAGFERVWRGFLRYRNAREGWWQEYDGADPGYLSATVSFLGKLYQRKPSPEIVGMAREAIEFASHFAYPDGHFAGNMGSRQTLHFYPHGVEIFANQIPLAGALAQRMQEGLARRALVPPAIMPDRYMPWRLAEFLLAYRDAQPRANTLPSLPYEGPSFHRWYPEAGIDVRRAHDMYALVNLAKGGVIKVFNIEQRRQVLSDCGVAGRLADGRMVTSQWIDSRYRTSAGDDELTVSGALQQMASMSSFTPAKMVAFRTMLATVGRSARASHMIKGAIRRALMLGTKAVPLAFQRRVRFEDGAVTIVDEIRRTGDVRVAGLMVGDEVAVRYVPQSRFFQLPELDTHGYTLTPDDLAVLHTTDRIRITRRVDVASGEIDVRVGDRLVSCARTPAALAIHAEAGV